MAEGTRSAGADRSWSQGQGLEGVSHAHPGTVPAARLVQARVAVEGLVRRRPQRPDEDEVGETVRPLDGLGLAAVATGIVLVQSCRAAPVTRPVAPSERPG